MGGCMSKTQAVEYDPDMKQKLKQEKKQDAPQVKAEEDVSLMKHSGSKRSLSLLFKKEEEEYSELLKKQGSEEKDLIQKNESPNPLVNAVMSEKQEDSKACEIQSVIFQEEAKLDASQQMSKDLLKMETSTAASDVPSTTQRPYIETKHLNRNEPTSCATAVEIERVNVVDDGKGFEVCITGEGTETQVKTADTATVTQDASSSSRDESLNENDKNSKESVTELPSFDVENTFADVEGKDSDCKTQTNLVDNNPKTSQDSSAKVTSVDDCHKSDVEGKPLVATLPASENYALNGSVENTCMSVVQLSTDVGKCSSNNAQDENPVTTVQSNENIVAKDDPENEPIVDLKQNSQSVHNAKLNMTVPISGCGQEAYTGIENIDTVPVEDYRGTSLFVNTEEKGLESLRAIESQSDMEKPVDSIKEASSMKENTNSMLVDDCHGNSVISKPEETIIESREVSVVESRDSRVSTSIPIFSVVEAPPVPPSQENEEKLVREPLETCEVVEEGENQIQDTEIKRLDGQAEKQIVSTQGDNETMKAVTEAADVDKNDKNPTQSYKFPEKDVPIMHQEVEKGNILVIENASKGNDAASSTNLEERIGQNDEAVCQESVGDPHSNDNISIKHELPSKDVPPSRENEEKLVREPLETCKVVEEGENQIQDTEIKRLDGQAEKQSVSTQGDNETMKAVTETADVDKNDKNPTHSNKFPEKDVPIMHQEVEKGDIHVIENAPKGNDAASSTNLEKRIGQDDEADSLENVGDLHADDSISIKHELPSKDVPDNC